MNKVKRRPTSMHCSWWKCNSVVTGVEWILTIQNVVGKQRR